MDIKIIGIVSWPVEKPFIRPGTIILLHNTQEVVNIHCNQKIAFMRIIVSQRLSESFNKKI